ncbi:MAG: glutamate--tRNA ligase [Patescibacteria group bacterium]|nr:glutamate--tRNA ligase [Patescibacteria group bacterium]
MDINTQNKVRVRFAPSPTGHFHIGGARVALNNFLFARHNNGKFILRIEDTDPERSKKEFEKEIYESLRWLGIKWDEGPVSFENDNQKVGEYGPYRQSERREIYKKYLQKLLDEKKAYWCYCTKEELEAQKNAMIADGLIPKYPGHCRNLTNPPLNKKPQTIRFVMPETKVEFKDLIRGKLVFDTTQFGDIVIAKDLESPLYNFAAVVDDFEMKITHVIRGEDHISNTPKQILLQRALGFPELIYAHLPLILNPDRSKLSKRFAEVSLLSYKEEGYLPEALINFLILLGWHPKDDKEIFSLEELIKEFDLNRVQKAGAIFNEEKLNWINSKYIKNLDLNELLIKVKPFFLKENIIASDDFILKILKIEKERMKTLKDIISLSKFFFELEDYNPKILIWKNGTLEKTKEILEKLYNTLQLLNESDFEKTMLFNKLTEIINLGNYSRGEVFWPLRVALSGRESSPDPTEIAEILGKEKSLERIKIAINKLK